MRKKIAGLAIILCLCLTGCGETIVNEYGSTVAKIGPYIEISRREGSDPFGNKYKFLTVYREDTKVIYEIIIRSYGISIHEPHLYDEEGHPILQFYEDGKIVTK